MRLIILMIFMFVGQLALAADAPTIYDSSVNWDNVAERTTLLDARKVAEWDHRIIKTVYDIYAHPEEHHLRASESEQKFNTTFLDAYWGPITNPFVKYARPAKVFVYVGHMQYMAPIVKNTTDGNFYVFSRAHTEPQLLDHWINDLKSQQPSLPIKFNVCNGYGNLKTDTCEGKSYQAEQRYALNMSASMSHANAVSKVSPSAFREPREDWRSHMAKVKAMTKKTEDDDSSDIYKSSIDWSDIKLRKKLLGSATAWSSYKVIQDNFEKLRDLRYFDDEDQNGFLRRISWLFPDDGCWTRASAVVNHLFGTVDNSINHFNRPSKIFAFGNLCANTPNHPKGRVTWWYHTAPLIRDAESKQAYVLDPSIDARRPMTVEAWVDTISSNKGACQTALNPRVEKINVCTGFGTGPFDDCAEADFAREAVQALRQSTYQHYERKRQIDLQRDADKVLGDEAPWM